MTIMTSLSPRALSAPESGIVEVVNYARGRDGLIPLWVGEGDLPTPDFITRAAAEALVAGETFYTWQRGIPPLREALVRYYQRRFQKTLAPENFYVTGSGMQAIKLSIEAIASPGDEMVLLTPAWPNFAAAADLSGVRPVSVPLRFENGKWQL
ncbi:MAG: aminotransferase class I/II-fold pyridoxal phosphate-dependent enzyme, partial [Sinorhizobium fredii]|nr:aminotransferase class I/II-fold pyridoxal phosphate-dependent enzyme [Sinorhizobium fredii]